MPEKELYLGQVEDMHTAILDGTPTYLTLSEARDQALARFARYYLASNKMPPLEDS